MLVSKPSKMNVAVGSNRVEPVPVANFTRFLAVSVYRLFSASALVAPREISRAQNQRVFGADGSIG